MNDYDWPFFFSMGIVPLRYTAEQVCSGTIFAPYPTEKPYQPDPEKELRKMVIQKFIRQLVPNPTEHALIMKHFCAEPTLLLLLMFHKDEVLKTAVALETEILRKTDIDYENKVFMGEDKDKSFSLKDLVFGKEKEGKE